MLVTKFLLEYQIEKKWFVSLVWGHNYYFFRKDEKRTHEVQFSIQHPFNRVLHHGNRDERNCSYAFSIPHIRTCTKFYQKWGETKRKNPKTATAHWKLQSVTKTDVLNFCNSIVATLFWGRTLTAPLNTATQKCGQAGKNADGTVAQESPLLLPLVWSFYSPFIGV